MNHSAEWAFSGYNEIQEPWQRTALIDYVKLSNVLGIESYDLLRASHREWVEKHLGPGNNGRERRIDTVAYVRFASVFKKKKAGLGIRAKGRRVRGHEKAYELREPQAPYGDDFDLKNGGLRFENIYLWNIFPDISI